MDALRLLSRATKKTSKTQRVKIQEQHPSSGPSTTPLLFTSTEERPRKRRRSSSEEIGPNFFTSGSTGQDGLRHGGKDSKKLGETKGNKARTEVVEDDVVQEDEDLDDETSLDQRKQIYSKNKLKLSWLNAADDTLESKHLSQKQAPKPSKIPLFPPPLQSFSGLARYAVPSRLIANVDKEGYTIPTEVQLAALPILLDNATNYLPQHMTTSARGIDLLTVAPTGSGKTLAFLLPLIHRVCKHKRAGQAARKQTLAVILAPTKELVSQIVNECNKLAEGTGVKVTQVRKGMKLPHTSKTAGTGENAAERPTEVKSNILVSTPGLMHSMIRGDEEEPSSAVLGGVEHLILDEADVLLDPLFREQTLGVWNSLGNTDLRVELWSATIGSSIEELARETIANRRKRLSSTSSNTDMHDEAPLIRLVVGLKDSAIPNVKHKLIYAATEQGKLMGLRQLLHPSSSDADSVPALRPPFLVFTQTIERAVALHAELLYDIPAEAGGISRIAVLHSDLSDTARSNVMSRFRKGEIWVLITTDLLSRGIDFRGVNGVVNYDIPTTSAAYVHRVGRTGRAGRQGGIAVTFYSKEDIPYMRNIANVISAAQKQRPETIGKGDGVDQWLLDALPSLSKQDKNKLKKHGVSSRTARGKASDPKAARKSKISTKAGFQRRVENRRKGAVESSRRRGHDDADEGHHGNSAGFEGFD